MKMLNMTTLLQVAGVMHFGLLAAGLLMPRAIGLREHLALLPSFIRRLYWVYYLFIGFCLLSFGSLTFCFAGGLAKGGSLARGVCIFLTLFWLMRLLAAVFVFDVRPYLVNRWWRAGYHATNVVFSYLPVVYGLAAWKGGTP